MGSWASYGLLNLTYPTTISTAHTLQPHWPLLFFNHVSKLTSDPVSCCSLCSAFPKSYMGFKFLFIPLYQRGLPILPSIKQEFPSPPHCSLLLILLYCPTYIHIVYINVVLIYTIVNNFYFLVP